MSPPGTPWLWINENAVSAPERPEPMMRILVAEGTGASLLAFSSEKPPVVRCQYERLGLACGKEGAMRGIALCGASCDGGGLMLCGAILGELALAIWYC